ncbi:MAG: OmpA family protein [Proteobacteria bacterium]|nr:OmpA family protein [Pseudomonadota bacterium]
MRFLAAFALTLLLAAPAAAQEKVKFDRDGDGITRSLDACPKEAEDLDGWEDEDGCPDADNDGDLILDVDDECPNEREDFDFFEDENGCPDPDHDYDGVDNADDRCPGEIEDHDGFFDDDGCADPDNDEDGILDGDDACPNAAETVDGWEDEDGCPDPDNDGDNIADELDLCPDQAEEYNWLRDVDGCPDALHAVIAEHQIVLLQPITFMSRTSRLDADSGDALQAVADLLLQNPQILQLRVEGHTDSSGDERKNVKLSEGRAGTVAKALIDLGVEPARLEASGFGGSRAAAGAEENRRIEFRIIAQADPQVQQQQVSDIWGPQPPPTDQQVLLDAPNVWGSSSEPIAVLTPVEADPWGTGATPAPAPALAPAQSNPWGAPAAAEPIEPAANVWGAAPPPEPIAPADSNPWGVTAPPEELVLPSATDVWGTETAPAEEPAADPEIVVPSSTDLWGTPPKKDDDD